MPNCCIFVNYFSFRLGEVKGGVLLSSRSISSPILFFRYSITNELSENGAGNFSRRMSMVTPPPSNPSHPPEEVPASRPLTTSGSKLTPPFQKPGDGNALSGPTGGMVGQGIKGAHRRVHRRTCQSERMGLDGVRLYWRQKYSRESRGEAVAIV